MKSKKRNYEAVKRVAYELAMSYSRGKRVHLNSLCKLNGISPKPLQIAIRTGIIKKVGKYSYKPVGEFTDTVIDDLYDQYNKTHQEQRQKRIQIRAEREWFAQADEPESGNDQPSELKVFTGDGLTRKMIKIHINQIINSLMEITDLL